MSINKYTNDIDVLKCWFSHTSKITARELATAHRISEARVRGIINYLRSNGVCICSDRNGYWLANHEWEVDATIKSLKSRINHIQSAIDGLENRLGD